MTNYISGPMLTLDIEANCRAPLPFDKMSPSWPENKIVLFVSKRVNKSVCCPAPKDFDTTAVIVGHNIKFDLKHVLKAPLVKINGVPFMEYVAKNDVAVWDTQIAEYILTGQTTTYASLDDLSAKYGGTEKDDKIKEYWAAGKDTSEIPVAELNAYAKEDVKNTERIALKQMEIAKDRGMLEIILSSCACTVALASMEHNGMHIDTTELSLQREAAGEKATLLRTEMQDLISDPVLKGEYSFFDNVDSTQQLKKALFGGEIIIHEKVLAGKYKNGNDKYKIQSKKVPVQGLLAPILHTLKDTTTVDEENLTSIVKYMDSLIGGCTYGEMVGYSLMRKTLEYRKVTKILGTYLNNLTSLQYPDGAIHGHLDQVLTPTGRINSSKPNLQNYPSKDDDIVKRCFSSRFPGGTLLEADYKQLEVVCLAHLSKDPRLIQDIQDGVDVHSAVGERVFGHAMSKEQRRVVKTVNFGLIYGGGVKTISSQSGQPEPLVKSIIDSFYDRYPGVKAWQISTKAHCEGMAEPCGEVSKMGFPIKRSVLISETGRRYSFKEYDTPKFLKDRGIDVGFSPTELKNYPVQGLATGDIVPMMVGVLWKEIYKDPVLRDKCLMINTVHDSILFDIHPDVVVHAHKKIKEVLESTAFVYEKKFGKHFHLPLEVEISVGKNWKDLKAIDK